MRKITIIFLIFPFYFFPQITDSIVLIKNYFTPDASFVRFKNRNFHDSVIANTFPTPRHLGMENGKYLIDRNEVSREAFYVELQKQTDQDFKPFRRVEYFPSGQLKLRGNFYHGDGLYDSCYSYHENGKLAGSSKVTLDTMGTYIQPGRKRPNIIQKDFLHKTYDKNGVLTEVLYKNQSQVITEKYEPSGHMKSRLVKPLKKQE